MAKRYEGNTGRVRPLEERTQPREHPAPPPEPSRREPPHAPGPGLNPLSELLPRQLQRMLSGSLRDLETEDLLLMLILYLLYRESGDPEWLLTLAAMVFLS
jgi:hypothetical protein